VDVDSNHNPTIFFIEGQIRHEPVPTFGDVWSSERLNLVANQAVIEGHTL
jgi:hypothetical protein